MSGTIRVITLDFSHLVSRVLASWCEILFLLIFCSQLSTPQFFSVYFFRYE